MENLLPGFRFFPTEEELVSFYLYNKLQAVANTRVDSIQVIDRVIPVLDIYNFDPRELPQLSGEICRRDPEQWFFFVPMQESEATGGRPKRLTSNGYWKATGSPGYVYSNNDYRYIGVKRTMVFYKGRAPNGRKTEWKMNEYKAIQGDAPPPTSSGKLPTLRQEYSLCRVYKQSSSLRTFDRRPSGAEVVEAEPRPRRGTEGIRSSDQQGPPDQRTSSRESTSSGDHPLIPSTAGESSSAAAASMDINKDDPFWHWQQLEWL